MNLKVPIIKETAIKWSNSKIKFFDDFNLQNPKLGQIKISIDKDSDDFDEIHIMSKSGKSLAYDTFIMGLSNKLMEDFFMRVNHNLCQSGARLGEILRLTSIMELMKNNLDKIKLYSKDTAVIFHSKYGFEPKIKSFDERNQLIKKIRSLENPEYRPLKEKAEDLAHQIELDSLYPEKQRQYCVDASLLGKEYIENLLQNGTQGDSTPFLYGMSMELTKDKILKNKEFYNNLYKKHGIDFEL
ncbi:MAG: hypothetical protein LKG27_01465 [Clostridiaceae bacterium]|jgi:hypothetical protein|nr:hypothetical protein [Clostridiaceae bacterium]